MTTLNVSNNLALSGLGCSQNQLTYLQFSDNLSLNSLNCNQNQLHILDVNNCKALTSLSCNQNQLTTLNVSNNLALSGLDCSQNQLTFLQFSDNLSLNSLNCNNNQFASLDVSMNKSLVDFKCSNNKLAALDVSNNTNLANLYCDNNKLTSLFYSKNSPLIAIYCNDNLLQYIPEFSSNLKVLDCSNNSNLKCLPKLSELFFSLKIKNTSIKCLPNNVDFKISDVDLKSYPLCDIKSGCPYYGNISGNIHMDTSVTCQLDSLYQGSKIKNIKVDLIKNSTLLKQYYANYFGDYTFTTDLDDTLVVKVDTINNPFKITCPSNQEYEVVITPTENFKGNFNFGLTCKGSADYGVSSISAMRFRPSFQTDVFINAGDIAKSFHGIDCGFKLAGTVKIEIFGPVSYVKPGEHALTPNSIANNNQTLIYNIADFGSLMDSSFNIVALTKSPITLADSVVYIKVTVSPDTKDYNSSNDSLTLCFPVRNSFDPNAKEVYPNTKVAGDKFVYYTVHFQNTGNDTAYTVVIKDTLSNKLNTSSFQFLNASHRVITELENNIVTFTFPRINLVDSLTNESLSHGWVQFKIKTDPSVNVITEVDNTAHIYFDTNNPIATNVAYINHLTTSSSELALNKEKLFIYPNPARNAITITLKTSDTYNLTLRNTFGQTVLTKPFKDNSCTVMLDGLPTGIYYVTVNNESGYWVEKVVKE